MRIVYDHQIFSTQEWGGISRYFLEIARRMAARPDCEVRIVAPAHINRFLKENACSGLVRGYYVPRIPRTDRLRRMINDAATLGYLRRGSTDVVHETYFTRRRLASHGSRIVVTVYDMIFEKFPHQLPSGDPTPLNKAAAVERADHVICISEVTRRDLIEILGVDPVKTSVVHLGASLRGVEEAPVSLLPGPYVLYVGNRRYYKNFSGLLEAVAWSRWLSQSFFIVAFGGERWTTEDERRLEERNLRGRVIHCTGSDGNLAWLYRHASLLVCPSLYEGFGLPVLEAMEHGCPVACSRAGSLPEIAGDAAVYFDPHNPGDIGRAIEDALSSGDERRRLSAVGRTRAQAFSWSRCAAETYQIYQSLAALEVTSR